MRNDYSSDDVYTAFGRRANLLPASARKGQHPDIRDGILKPCLLGVGYGMGAKTLGRRIKSGTWRGRQLLRAHREHYWRFWEWCEQTVDHAVLSGWIGTDYGWRLTTPARDEPSYRTLRNFTAQTTCADILRLACVFIVEDGIELVGPIHDAVLVHVPLDDLEAQVVRVREHMAEAGRVVLDGFLLGTDAVIIRPGERFLDRRSVAMWQTLRGVMRELEPATWDEVSGGVLIEA